MQRKHVLSGIVLSCALMLTAAIAAQADVISTDGQPLTLASTYNPGCSDSAHLMAVWTAAGGWISGDTCDFSNRRMEDIGIISAGDYVFIEIDPAQLTYGEDGDPSNESIETLRADPGFVAEQTVTVVE